MSFRSLEFELLLAAVEGVIVTFGFVASASVILAFDGELKNVDVLCGCDCAGRARSSAGVMALVLFCGAANVPSRNRFLSRASLISSSRFFLGRGAPRGNPLGDMVIAVTADTAMRAECIAHLQEVISK